MNQSEVRHMYEIIDRALSSKNPTVKEALKELLIVTSLSEESSRKGELVRLLDSVEKLSYDVGSLREELHRLRADFSYVKNRPPNGPLSNDYDIRYENTASKISLRNAMESGQIR